MDDEHEDKRFDQGNTQGGIPRDGAESDNGIQSNQKKDSGNGRGDVVGQTDHEVDGRGDPQDGNGRQTIIGASLWDGPTPSPGGYGRFQNRRSDVSRTHYAHVGRNRTYQKQGDAALVDA